MNFSHVLYWIRFTAVTTISAAVTVALLNIAAAVAEPDISPQDELAAVMAMNR